MKVLERNYKTRLGEIDLIVKDGSYICFIEVKYRSSSLFGYPSEAVDKRKKRKIISVAKIYLKDKHLINIDCRFDVVEILDKRIRLIKDCFGRK